MKRARKLNNIKARFSVKSLILFLSFVLMSVSVFALRTYADSITNTTPTYTATATTFTIAWPSDSTSPQGDFCDFQLFIYNYADNYWQTLTGYDTSSPYTGNFPSASTYTPDGGTYQVKIGCWGGGPYGSFSSSSPIYMVANTSLPFAPTHLAVTSPVHTPVLSWDAVSGATSYNIYRNGIDVGSSSDTSFTDSSAPEGYDIYYVTAVNSDGEGNSSNTVTVEVDRTPPILLSTPNWSINPVAVGYDSTVSVNVTTDGIAGEFYIGDTDPGQGNGTPMTYHWNNGYSYLDASLGSSLQPGTYTVNIRATDPTGNWSNVISSALTVTATPPATPTNLAASSPTTRLFNLLRWDSIPGATSYNIYRDGTKVGSSTTNYYSDTSALPGNNGTWATYTYYVTAVNPNGESSDSNTVSVLIGNGGTIWDLIPTYTTTATTFTTAWPLDTVSPNGGLCSFQVFMYNYADNYWLTLGYDISSPPYTGNFPSAATYTPDGHTYQLRLGCQVGISALYYSPSIYIHHDAAPVAPTNLTASSPTQNPALSWATVSEAISYNIYRDGTKIDSSTTNSYTDNSATQGSHVYYVTAVNSAGESSPSNSITVVVGTVPAFTSPSTVTTGQGAPFSFTVTTTGSPAPALSYTGNLPAGTTFTDNGNGTATISGTITGTAGTYLVLISANNGIGGTVNQDFILTVDPVNITSAVSSTATYGSPYSFTVTATGNPTPTLTKTGALPMGVTFTDNGDGTATIAGTPTGSASGVYTLTMKAKNSQQTVTQTFVLTVNRAPTINNVTTKTTSVGTAFSMTVNTNGYNTPAITESGTLPNGLTFSDNGDGTATIAGTPTTGSGNSYSITITATNQLGTTSQTFTLRVKEAPTITSATTANATVGSAFSFQVTDTGFPDPSISKTGTLPSGITFQASTGTFSGTPRAGTAGSYPITITVTNSSGAVTQNYFVLVVA